MARLNWKKALTQGGKGALAAAPSGNPALIGISAGVSALPALFTPERKFDPTPFRRALQRHATGVRRGARRAASETGATQGSSLAARGLGRSPLGAGIIAGQQRLALQRAEDQIAQAEGQLEMEIAQTQAGIEAAKQQEQIDDLLELSGGAMGVGAKTATTDSPLREKLGLPRIAPDANDLTVDLDDMGLRREPDGSLLTSPRAKSLFGRDINPDANQPKPQPQPKSQPKPGRSVPFEPGMPLSVVPQKLSDTSSDVEIDDYMTAANIPKNSLVGRLLRQHPGEVSTIIEALGLPFVIDALSVV